MYEVLLNWSVLHTFLPLIYSVIFHLSEYITLLCLNYVCILQCILTVFFLSRFCSRVRGYSTHGQGPECRNLHMFITLWQRENYYYRKREFPTTKRSKSKYRSILSLFFLFFVLTEFKKCLKITNYNHTNHFSTRTFYEFIYLEKLGIFKFDNVDYF